MRRGACLLSKSSRSGREQLKGRVVGVSRSMKSMTQALRPAGSGQGGLAGADIAEIKGGGRYTFNVAVTELLSTPTSFRAQPVETWRYREKNFQGNNA